MNVTWVIEKSTFAEDIQPLIDEIGRQGHQLEFIRLFDIKPDPAESCRIFYGSIQSAREIQKQTRWIPGCYANFPAYDCTYYYPRLNRFLLNSHYMMLPFGDLDRRKTYLFDQFGNNNCIFVRPNSGCKLFTGQIIELDRWDRELEILGNYYVAPESLVVIAEPKNIVAEWRLIVANNRIISGSRYKPDHDGNLPCQILEFSQSILDNIEYSPDSVWCLDVCETKSGELFVLETNSFSCAGLYNSMMEPIVREISQIAFLEWKEYQ